MITDIDFPNLVDRKSTLTFKMFRDSGTNNVCHYAFPLGNLYLLYWLLFTISYRTFTNGRLINRAPRSRRINRMRYALHIF